MSRRAVLVWMLAALLQQGLAGVALADKGRGRGRGGDDEKDDDDSDDDDDDDDDDEDDDDDDGAVPGNGGAATGEKTKGGGRPSDQSAVTVVIRYADGSVERIRNGRYQRIDASGAIVEDRPGQAPDQVRLSAARPGRGHEMVIRIDSRAQEVETVDRSGWRERIVGGTYLLTDPSGNVVRHRKVRAADLARIKQLSGG